MTADLNVCWCPALSFDTASEGIWGNPARVIMRNYDTDLTSD